MKKSLLILALSTLAFGVSAQASETPSFYASAGAIQSHVTTSVPGVDTNATAGTVSVGAAFNQNLAVELSYYDFGSRKVTGFNNARGNAVGVQAVLSYPLGNDFSVFVKPGILQTHADIAGVSRDSMRFSLGGGVEYAINKNVALTASLQRINNFADIQGDATFVTAGLKYNF